VRLFTAKWDENWKVEGWGRCGRISLSLCPLSQHVVCCLALGFRSRLLLLKSENQRRSHANKKQKHRVYNNIGVCSPLWLETSDSELSRAIITSIRMGSQMEQDPTFEGHREKWPRRSVCLKLDLLPAFESGDLHTCTIRVGCDLQDSNSIFRVRLIITIRTRVTSITRDYYFHRTSNATSWFSLRAAQCLRQRSTATSKRPKWALMSPFSWTKLILMYLRARWGKKQVHK